MESQQINVKKVETKAIPETETTPEYLSPSSTTFEGPVKTLDQLRQALIQKMGTEKGQEMYDNFIQSILISAFGTMHKDMDRAQKASKKMRSIYKE
ncbi:hypothetical protein [Candidatus Chlamydia sanziniae]|uniref:Uncharacterized protein n=1 Tax=Candidatus Chlamydia sanziniae TaxID=1806891 RepID=A0A1A9HWP8_9CHLA|nr:hypothetical protein [Candidatus Chlamydia sanziniae]ANH78523.1 hypothetical protein Cs308_0352 [Candidatus Chlamydia sanziniae]